MSKSKPQRDMTRAGNAQKEIEQSTHDKFSETENLAHNNVSGHIQRSTTGRLSPQLSCTISAEDKESLNKLTLHLSNKAGKIINTSTIVRALIRLGERYKDELEI